MLIVVLSRHEIGQPDLAEAVLLLLVIMASLDGAVLPKVHRAGPLTCRRIESAGEDVVIGSLHFTARRLKQQIDWVELQDRPGLIRERLATLGPQVGGLLNVIGVSARVSSSAVSTGIRQGTVALRQRRPHHARKRGARPLRDVREP